ncbi:pyruvate kinase [Pseudobacteriovorax antillogorgiicola]|uniref:pyruvate kinase n=1 Tax=Pseudobacteriovorax antillogorgiicola TaxID=1513793 RepID=A0A1Y6CSQ0_9BACT|nr:pyruvate kinase [Pseudobacteriovorax antillogorgiicola]TCS45396.1 pyruvate kinase [Pseudobacteriovorax antillogorgiicola]SMF73855.1 pyruvate kinase [Pseudobacteriovorax antillogorgiicola]
MKTSMTSRLANMQQQLAELIEQMDGARTNLSGSLPGKHQSLTNFLQYLCVRDVDLRPLQDDLQAVGLSSLGRSELAIHGSMKASHAWLLKFTDNDFDPLNAIESVDDELKQGKALLDDHTEKLLGPKRGDRRPRIMVTIPSDAHQDQELITQLMDGGMELARINCGHGSIEDQFKTALEVKHLARKKDLDIKVMCDLSGPKIRTRSLGQGPGVFKLKTTKDAYGHVLTPARVHLVSYPLVNHSEPCLPVCGQLSSLNDGDVLHFRDLRGRKRRAVVEVFEDHRFIKSYRNAYLGNVTRLHRGHDLVLAVSHLEPWEIQHRIHQGELFSLCLSMNDYHGEHFCIEANFEAFWDTLAVGDPVVFDDGRLATVVHDKDEISGFVVLKVLRAPSKGFVMKGDRGINFPDQSPQLAALTADDQETIDLLHGVADIFAFSFIKHAQDVRELRQFLNSRQLDQSKGVVLKIETKQAINHLPSIIIEGLKLDQLGIMIARGDLAVEVGFSRLSELQEEILTLARAAHVPVIWATQVLESLAKSGLPSRGDVSDVSRGERADCIMLNQGDFILDALQMTHDVCCRMAGHQRQNTTLMRELAIVKDRHLDSYQHGSERLNWT